MPEEGRGRGLEREEKDGQRSKRLLGGRDCVVDVRVRHRNPAIQGTPWRWGLLDFTNVSCFRCGAFRGHNRPDAWGGLLARKSLRYREAVFVFCNPRSFT